MTIDYETLEQGTVTIRDRDSMNQVKLNLGQLFGVPEGSSPEIISSMTQVSLSQRALPRNNDRWHKPDDYLFER